VGALSKPVRPDFMWRAVVKGSVRELWGLGRFSANPALSQCSEYWALF
jgi:hypothetical protein